MSERRTESVGHGIRVDHRAKCRSTFPRCRCPMSWWEPQGDGTRKRRTGFIGTLTDARAEKAASKLRSNATPPTPALGPASAPTLYHFAQARLSDRYAARGQHAVDRYEAAYRLRIHAEFGARPLDAITVDDVEAWCDRLVGAEGNIRAVEYAFVTLRWLLNEAVRRRHITYNPCASIAYARRYGRSHRKVPTDQKRALSAAEYERLKAAAQEEGVEAILRIRLAAEGALRRAELAGLRWRDLDAERCTLRIDEAVTYTKATGLVVGATKTRASTRTVGLPPDLFALLARYRAELAAEPEGEHFVFPGRLPRRRRRDPTSPITPRALTRWLRRLMERHGITTESGAALTTFHGLRRTGATLAIASPIFVQKQLGHSSFAMTERSYVVLDDTDSHDHFAKAFTS